MSDCKGQKKWCAHGTIFRAFLGAFVVASQHFDLHAGAALSINRGLPLLDQLKFDTVAFFTSARTVDSNDVKNYVRYGRAFTVPRCF